MRGFPAWYPDMNVWAPDPPLSWPVNVRHNGRLLDLAGLDLSAPVTDDGVQVGELEIEIINADYGKLSVTLTPELFAILRNYSTWQLRENETFRAPLVQGRIVRCS
jgi:hypothetical protein